MSNDLWDESEMKMYIKHLNEISEMLFVNDQIISVALIGGVIKFMKRLAAENATLTAEVDRLTTEPMTLKEACDVLNERKLRGRAWYRSTSESNISDLYNELVLKPKEAVYIAQGLLRDGGPTVVREPAKGEGGEEC